MLTHQFKVCTYYVVVSPWSVNQFCFIKNLRKTQQFKVFSPMLIPKRICSEAYPHYLN